MLSVAACRTASMGAPVQEQAAQTAPLAADEDVVILAGRIDPTDVRQVQESKIEVYRVHEEGRLELVSVDKVFSDETGRYQAPIKMPKDTGDLLVVSSKDGLKGYGTVLVPSWSVVDQVIVAPPISLETQVETDVYFAAVKAGIWPQKLGATEIRKVVNKRMALQLRSSTAYDQDVAIMAQAAVASIQSWYRVLLASEAGVEPGRVGTVLEALAWAQVALDAQLYAAESVNDEEDAHAIYEVAVRACYSGIGIGPEHLAVAAQASADAMRKMAPAMSDNPRMTLTSEAEGLRAKYVTSAVEALFARAGASEKERQAVNDAGERLNGKIQSAPQEAEEMDDFLKNAWSEYRNAVQGRLESIAEKSTEEVI
jgi:hypothetical protein